MSNLFLFGAGASYGSQSSAVPPLGCDLFEALRRFDPGGWGALDDDSAQLFRQDFERGMSGLPGYLFQSLQLTLAHYLFSFEPSGGNLYRQLAKRIRKYENRKRQVWRGAFSTLNYDRLLQSAMIESGIRTYLVSPRVDHYELCVLHGLCNLFSANVQAPGIQMLDPSCSIEDTNLNLEHDLVTTQAAFAQKCSFGLPPIMSFYEPSKRSSMHPKWLEGRRQRFSQLIAGAERISVVGVRVHKVDTHIWEPLRSTSAKVLYCAPEIKEFLIWRNENRLGGDDDQIAQGTFREKFCQVLDFVGL